MYYLFTIYLLNYFSNGTGEESFLLLLYARGEGIGCVVGQHGHSGLRNDTTAIHLGTHVVHRTTCFRVACCQYGFLHANAIHTLATMLRK